MRVQKLRLGMSRLHINEKRQRISSGQPAQQPGTFPTNQSVVPVLTLSSQPHFHHQEDKLRSRGISIALQITSSIVFLAVNALGQSTSGRQGADWLTISGNTASTFLHGAQHFNSPDHSLKDVRVAVLESG